MNRVLFVIILIVFSFVFGCDWVIVPEQTGNSGLSDGSIGVRQSAISLGKIRSGSKLDSQFDFINNSPAIVKITGLRGGCSCIVGGAFPIVVPPNGSAAIPFYFDARGKPDGDFQSKLTVLYLADGKEQRCSFGVFADILGEDYLTVSPPYFSFEISNPVDFLQQRDSRVFLKGRNGTIPGKLVFDAPDWLQISLIDQSPSNSEVTDWLLSAKVRENGYAGSFYGEIVIKSENGLLLTTLPVTAKILTNIEIQPASITCSNQSAATLVLRMKDGSSLSLETVDVINDQGLEINVSTTEKGFDFINLSISSRSANPFTSGHLLVRIITWLDGNEKRIFCRIPYLFIK